MKWLDDQGVRHSVAPVSAAELHTGAFAGDPPERESATELLDSLRWLSFDRDVTRRAGRIQSDRIDAGDPIGFTDCMIAATAIEHDEAIVSADADFERIPELTLRRY